MPTFSARFGYADSADLPQTNTHIFPVTPDADNPRAILVEDVGVQHRGLATDGGDTAEGLELLVTVAQDDEDLGTTDDPSLGSGDATAGRWSLIATTNGVNDGAATQHVNDGLSWMKGKLFAFQALEVDLDDLSGGIADAYGGTNYLVSLWFSYRLVELESIDQFMRLWDTVENTANLRNGYPI